MAELKVSLFWVVVGRFLWFVRFSLFIYTLPILLFDYWWRVLFIFCFFYWFCTLVLWLLNNFFISYCLFFFWAVNLKFPHDFLVLPQNGQVLGPIPSYTYTVTLFLQFSEVFWCKFLLLFFLKLVGPYRIDWDVCIIS